ncbi:17168_t:CDS:2, partial [Cetraspora pellucida]
QHVALLRSNGSNDGHMIPDTFNTHVDECINLIDDIDEKQEDEIRGDSHFEIKKQESCPKDEIHDNDFSLTSGKLSNIFRKDIKKSFDESESENEFDEGFFSKLSFGPSKKLKCLNNDDDEVKDFKNEKVLKTNEIVNKKRKKKPSKVIPWTKAEEGQLMQAIETHGTKWSVVREAMGCKRAAYCYQSHWNVMKKRL